MIGYYESGSKNSSADESLENEEGKELTCSRDNKQLQANVEQNPH